MAKSVQGVIVCLGNSDFFLGGGVDLDAGEYGEKQNSARARNRTEDVLTGRGVH